VPWTWVRKGLDLAPSQCWVFTTRLTNVNVVLKVTDTVTGAVVAYNNPQGTPFQPIQDTSAFACP
jgi:hypothetical protein